MSMKSTLMTMAAMAMVGAQTMAILWENLHRRRRASRRSASHARTLRKAHTREVARGVGL